MSFGLVTTFYLNLFWQGVNCHYTKPYLGEFKAENGALSGTCHKQPDQEKVDIATAAYSKTAYANPLNPDAFPGVRKMEAEVVRMCCNLFNGDPETSCGTVNDLQSWKY